ncbi:MAG: ribosomal L7Ae/L30e/S12e/Gadd45 family protein [Clostridia bacterium]|nr:ribosomal L7Ae/L30e/S12e/Gadd45 family protein [Clostridia bacterium]
MEKIYSLLGFCAKSRNLITGYNSCIFSMNKRKIKLIIIAEDLADNSKEKIIKACEKNEVKYFIISTMERLSKVTGKENCGIFGITEENFAQAISKEME